ncbi:hypothetical protein [Burkholderia gladioli]|uniref:hypothetical protein n=1 Tax=Burkholderia gladioli TaxID=28095 RepID=UPI00236374AB|nr:hypothetical protein [Burkholderia gladioli]MDD1789082.1 hypothetical protein [Burkholderia gladioli]MDN7724915.1 hypothetical protein [Burkholderia gladioli]
MNGIFESTEQALHVSFLVMSLPPRQKQTFRLTLIRILESIPKLTKRQAEFLDELYGTPSGTIDFYGLSGDEIRAQCAMVVAAVRDTLPDPERFAVWIRFARGMPKRPARAGLAADPGTPPSIEWKTGVLGMAAYLRPSLPVASRDPIMALIAAHSFPHQRESSLSYKAISDEYGVPIRTLGRAAMTVRKRLRELEALGIARLHARFVIDGLVDLPIVQVAAENRLAEVAD